MKMKRSTAFVLSGLLASACQIDTQSGQVKSQTQSKLENVDILTKAPTITRKDEDEALPRTVFVHLFEWKWSDIAKSVNRS